MTGEVWAFGEIQNGKLEDVTFEILTKGHELADARGSKLVSVLVGNKTADSAEVLASKGAEEVLCAESPLLEYYNPDLYAKILGEAITQRKPILVLFGHSYLGMDLAPIIATRFEAPLVSNALDAKIEGDKLVVTKPLYQGKIHAKIQVEPSELTVITFQKGIISPKELHAKGQPVITSLPVTIEDADQRIRTVGTSQVGTGGVDITKAEIVVAGGRGVGEQEKFQIIKELAEALGGQYACSRPLVDMGWLSSELQIGLSGKTIKPKLYVACGISGASQHIVGMKNAGVIVAINKDPKAPIFEVAHYGIVGNIFEVVPAVIEEVKKLKSK